MAKHTKKKKPAYRISCRAVLLTILLPVFLLTGCRAANEKVQSGMELVQNLDYQGALLQFEEAENAGENMRLVNRGRGIAYMGLIDYQSAIDCFKEALQKSNGIIEPIDFDLNYYLAAAYTKNGQYAEAKAAYDAILALHPDEENAYFLRGGVKLHLSDYEGAKTDFDAVVAMNPKNYDRLIKICETMTYFGYTKEGQVYLQNALAAGETDMAPFDIGRMYYYLGDYQNAAIALEEAKEKGGAESYLYLGKAYEATGDYNYASSVYNSFINKGTESSEEIYNQLGLCEMQKKDYRKALEAFQAGIKLEGNGMMQTLLFNEIVAYEYLGDYKTAAVCLQNYLSLYPDDEVALREQQFLSTR